MKNYLHALFFAFLVFAVATVLEAHQLPSNEEMNDLRPQPGLRLQVYDRMFPSVANTADEAHRLYTNPVVLSDLEHRLARVQETGRPEDILDTEERERFVKNMEQLRKLESVFFERWYLSAPMSAAIHFQRWLTVKNSPMPQGAEREALVLRLQEASRTNPLYSDWFQSLPKQWIAESGPRTWGELLVQFSADAAFRREWKLKHPSSLIRMLELSRIWAWEDSSVRAVTVYESGTLNEHWVLHRQDRVNVPNRFKMILDADMDSLIRLEYAPTVFFNRLSRIIKSGGSVTYYLEAVEKGRTMELTKSVNQNGANKKTFRGSEILRKSKSDEFVQRDYLQRGSLHLFLGMRTLQLNQIQELMKINPELVLAVGQFGFSITGGRAQTVSNRTDSPEEQVRKLTATLIDIIEFAKTKDVDAWFRSNTQHVLRTIIGGVGSGGAQALKDPTSSPRRQETLLCRDLF
ncbi:hypothetical protein K2X05_05320 [bacterium]|nr:hypothetical protein [bacterium]